MTKVFTTLLKFILIPFIILTIHYLFNFHRIQIDGLVNEIRFLISCDNTKYSDNYSDKKFRQIKRGMTVDELYKLVGRPLSKFPQKDTILLKLGRHVGLFYSNLDNSSNSNYRIRFVYIDSGFVTGSGQDVNFEN